ncbi:MAG TPA: lipase secretion chaperone [Pseudomonas sp.]|nr:lipase secretion chaperone [Pseudomonas sp.]
MSGKFFVAALAIAGLGGIAIAMALLPDEQPLGQIQPAAAPAPQMDTRREQASASNDKLRQTPVAQLADPGALPPSLQGSRHEVQLHADGNGQLVIDEGLLRLFDFYLAGIEEEGADKVLLRIHRELASQLQGATLEQARDLLQRYVSYRIALQDLPPSSASLDVATLRQRAEALGAVRLQYFSSEENQVFFARENAENDYMLQRLALAQRSDLNDAQRRQAIRELEDQLPSEIRAERAQATLNGELFSQVEQMQAQGASAEAIRLVREQALGSEAADRLAELDQQHALWNQRLSDYASERNRLRSAGLSTDDLQRAIAELQASRFDELERKRVQALDADL